MTHKRPAKPKAVRIRANNGTYFRCMTAIGPAFGASWKDAAVFSDGWQAYETMKHFPMIVMADLVNERRQKCDVEGRPLRLAAKKRRAKRG